MLAQHEYTLEPGADQMLRRIFTGLHAGEDSGNARFARTLFEQALNRQALRLSLAEEQSLDALDREAVLTLTAGDNVEAAVALGEGPAPGPSRDPGRARGLYAPFPRPFRKGPAQGPATSVHLASAPDLEQ